MSEVKYTKSELRDQQVKLNQLERYLPTLQLKKAMLQLEINQVVGKLEDLSVLLHECTQRAEGFSELLTDVDASTLFQVCDVVSVDKHFENIAGVDIPIFEGITFADASYSLLDTPYWLESGITQIQDLITTREKMTILSEKKRLLEKELREVSIRVNLFEKIMIPRTKENIKKIKIFLGDQQLAAVSQAKVSKQKIEQRKKKEAKL